MDEGKLAVIVGFVSFFSSSHFLALASQRVTGNNRKDRSDKRKLTKILLKVELKKNTCETTSFVKEKREVWVIIDIKKIIKYHKEILIYIIHITLPTFLKTF